MSKDAYHHGDLRNALIEAATQLIERDGHEGFSLREAAREVGVSANATYRHFADRSALLTAVARQGFDRLSRRMMRAMSAVERDDPSWAIARVKALGRAYVEFAWKHPALFGVMFSASGVPQRNAGSDVASPYELLGRALDELVVEGLLAAESRAGAELKAWSAVHGFARLVLDGAAHVPTGAARTDALASLLDFVVIGLCPEPRVTARGRR
ncbi:MAG TPA: TetR/AcrR family transcriptional regulator [Polyangiales bacterium]